jgi:hypothetical protein
MSMFGKRSTPSFEYPATPMTVMRRMRTVAKMGLRTQTAANH